MDLMATTTQNGEQSLRVFILDNPRTRSHLFLRYLSTNPTFRTVYHPYIFARWIGKDSHMHVLRNCKEYDQSLQQLMGDMTTAQCHDDFEKQLSKIENEGKHLLSNEHQINLMKHEWMLNALRDLPFEVPSNPTVIPDAIYETLSFVILVRHPILQVRSSQEVMSKALMAQPSDESFKLCVSVKHWRIVYDHLKAQGKNPIVVDTEDLLWRTKDLGEKLAQAWGIEDNFSDTWKPVSQAEWDGYPTIYPFIKDIAESDGIQRPIGGPKVLDLEKEFQVWTKSYGAGIAEQLREHVLLNMPEYEYLVRFKI